MKEEEIKSAFASNLVTLRKERRLTQAQLAEKLNYSDKSISKWERGDVLPDIVTFSAIAEYFGITINDLITKQTKLAVAKKKQHIVITLLSFAATWFIASIVFLILLSMKVDRAWLTFIVTIPISFVAPVVLSLLWLDYRISCALVSLLTWGLATAIFITVGKPELWFIYIVALLFQLMTIWGFNLIYVYNTMKHNNLQKNMQDNVDIQSHVS